MEEAGSEEYCGKSKATEMSEEAKADDHETAPCGKSDMQLHSYA